MTIRPCLEPDCRIMVTDGRSRCTYHEQERQRVRNRKRRGLYGNRQWREASRAARRSHPYCAVCGTTTDLTLDHERGQVECRACNSSHRRNPS